MEIFIGDYNYQIVKIPPGIINGWKNIGTNEAILAIVQTMSMKMVVKD